MLPRKTTDFARLPVAILDTAFFFMAFIALAFIVVLAFIALDFMTFFIAVFIGNAMASKWEQKLNHKAGLNQNGLRLFM